MGKFGYKYILRENHSAENVGKLSSELKISEITAGLLYKRGISDAEKAREYLYGNAGNIDSDFNLEGTDTACSLIFREIENKGRIVIYGDYDVDGITSAAQLYLFLKEAGGNVCCRLPHRENDGYGLNQNIIEEIISEGCNLLITVDCGTANYDEIDFASQNHVKTLILDHHQPQDRIPKADALINPYLNTEGNSYRILSAAGIVFKFIKYYCNKYDIYFNEDKYVQLAALGTVADMVPLENENRNIVKHGIKVINNSPLPGIKKLCREIDSGYIDSETIAYWIAPRINAAGRLEDPETAFRLLTTDSIYEAEKAAGELEQINERRKSIQAEIYEDILTNIQKFMYENIIIATGENWPPGILGILSSMLTNNFNMPSLVLTRDAGYYKGSGRSIPGINFFEILNECRHYLERFGGHSQAAGVYIADENLNLFSQSVDKYISDNVDSSIFTKKYLIDGILKEEHINIDIFREIQMLEPFGCGNEKPVFMLNNYKIKEIKQVGNRNDTTIMEIQKNRKSIKAVKFKTDDTECRMLADSKYLIGSTGINRYRNNENIQFTVMKDATEYFSRIYENSLWSAEEYNYLKTMIRRHKNPEFRANKKNLTEHFKNKINENFGESTIVKMLDSLKKEGFIEFSVRDEYIYIRKGD